MLGLLRSIAGFNANQLFFTTDDVDINWPCENCS